ncbi:kinase-like domain-containing protein [Zopfochytrium polystomum]|nr:kinase-like domain-containing protein [Zopfochytrium polystomum]
MDTSAAATAGSALGEPPSAVVDHSYLSSTGLREAIGPITAIVHDDTGMNSTVHLVTTQKGEYAIKAPKNVYAAGALHRERLVLQALTGLDGKHLNTPEHVAVVQCEGANDDEDRGGKRSAHVLSRLPGINGARLWKREDVSKEDRVAVAGAIGRTLRRIHDGWKPSVAPMRCGKDAAAPSPPEQSVFDGRSRGWLRTSLDTFYSPRIDRRLAALTEEEKEEGEDARRLLAKIRTVADTPASDKIWTDPPFWNDLVLVHGDAMVPNFLFEKDIDGEQGWRPTGIVDWGDAGYGDRRYDLGAGMCSLEHNEKMRLKEERGEAADAGEANEEQLERVVQSFLKGYGVEDVSQESRESIMLWMNLYDLFDFFAYSADEE